MNVGFKIVGQPSMFLKKQVIPKLQLSTLTLNRDEEPYICHDSIDEHLNDQIGFSLEATVLIGFKFYIKHI